VREKHSSIHLKITHPLMWVFNLTLVMTLKEAKDD
jgi:hypothetical protein